MKYMCPNCGEKCLSKNSGIQIQNPRSFKLPPPKCPECNTNISSQIQLKPMNRRNKIISIINNIFFTAVAILLAFLIIYSVFFEEIRITGIQILYSLLIMIAPFTLIILINLFAKDSSKRRIFAVVDENYQSVPIQEDIKVKLNTQHIKKPNRILHDYATFDFTLSNQNKTFPVIMAVILLDYEVKYYSLSFLGKRSGIKPPEVKEGDSFELTDCLGNKVNGSVECLFENKE